jgi:hypothetical protein
MFRASCQMRHRNLLTQDGGTLHSPSCKCQAPKLRESGKVRIFGQNFFWSMGEPVAEQEGLLLGEVAVVEDEQEESSLKNASAYRWIPIS